MARRVHVIGAGLAGLAAAVQLQRRGAQVVLYEAAGHAGGRCRSYYDDALGTTIDNGNHFVMSGNQATLGYARAIGAADELAGPASPEFSFVDVASGRRWSVRFSPGRLPLWIFDAAARVPGTQPADYLALAPLFFAKPGRTMAQTMRCDGVLWDRLLRPLFLAALKVEPRQGTAELAAAVARETFAAGGQACRPLVAKNGLGSAFVDPALRMLQHGGATIRLGARLEKIGFAGRAAKAAAHGEAKSAVGGFVDPRERAAALTFADGTDIALEPGESVVLAVPPEAAQTLVPGMRAPNVYSAAVNAHFAVAPPHGMPPLTGLVNATAEWLYAFDARLSATASGAERLVDMPREALAKTIWAEVAQAAGLPVDPMPAWQIVSENRAAFAALPSQEMLRPAAKTRWNNLVLAGDWTATGLPATIEGAIRSGQKAADTLLNQPMN
ncbi:FAD-dependent oxidoreductase [Trinickia terrae]|uniref:FAD-dependent oxidoreductase n=1 Tax=Trinickia terrae TaxID=2571161 RepID=A0A4U1I505_9BURK|nr:hydroxysqualene dehydroxylase HpnE [Trinickia terrae]TKC88376.1 FAD-dependent oxidoreductase [Trinickia terrae]